MVITLVNIFSPNLSIAFSYLLADTHDAINNVSLTQNMYFIYLCILYLGWILLDGNYL